MAKGTNENEQTSTINRVAKRVKMVVANYIGGDWYKRLVETRVDLDKAYDERRSFRRELILFVGFDGQLRRRGDQVTTNQMATLNGSDRECTFQYGTLP